MKKINVKIAFFGIALALNFGTVATSCSKDNNEYEEPTNGTIDAAVGTYKGKLRSNDLDQYEHFDAVIIVTKVDNQHVKVVAKSGEAYSGVTSKTFKVEHTYNGNIDNIDGILEGHFWYTHNVKTLEMGTDKQTATDITYLFDGTKQ